MTDTTPIAITPPAAEDAAVSARNRLVIGLLLVSTFVVILNETIMGVALPRIMDDLSIEPSSGQWLTTAYLLTTSVVIPITGFLLERLSTRTIYLIAMTAFTLGTLVCASAPGFGVLVVGRVVQATGMAIMMPLLMTTVMTLVPPSSRGRVMGNISIVISVAPAIGPAISGLILTVFDWRAMFWIVLPIAAAALVLGALRVPNVTETRSVPVDIPSVILSAFGFSGLVYGLSSFGEQAQGTATVSPWIPLVVGIVALVLFVLRQRRLQRRDDALLDLRVFGSPTYALGLAAMGVGFLTMLGTLIVLPIYTQDVLGISTLETGLLLLPGGLIMGLLAPFVGRVYDRLGPRVLLVPGSIILSLSLGGMALFGEHTSIWWVLAAHIGLSVGLALLFTPLFTASLGSLTPHLYSHGSAILGTSQQLAGAAGTALYVTILTARSVALGGSGASPVAAQTGGFQAAFLAGAIISLAVVVLVPFVRRPENEAAAVHGGMH